MMWWRTSLKMKNFGENSLEWWEMWVEKWVISRKFKFVIFSLVEISRGIFQFVTCVLYRIFSWLSVVYIMYEIRKMLWGYWKKIIQSKLLFSAEDDEILFFFFYFICQCDIFVVVVYILRKCEIFFSMG